MKEIGAESEAGKEMSWPDYLESIGIENAKAVHDKLSRGMLGEVRDYQPLMDMVKKHPLYQTYYDLYHI